ncbi:MAG TPA: ABC transporter substrate-binding protein [Candidatus Sulfomarinibacteraceae bacterium]|nr:ABC transporter substrate-binding protein [Candidatus Sulfomarinibacteraceae bacterium]
MKRFLYLMLLVLLTAGMVACGGTAEPTEAPAAEEPVEEPVEEPEEEPVEEPMEEEEPVVADGESIYLMGADGLLSDTFFQNVGQTGVGMYFSGPLSPGGAAYQDLVSSYEEMFGESPIQAFHSHAYDATMMALTAIDQVAEEQDDGSLIIDRQALIEAMYQMEHAGLTGNLICNEFGDCAAPSIGIFRFEDASWAAADVIGNVVSSYEFQTPDTGAGTIPDPPDGLELGEIVVAPGAPIEIATLQAISGAVANLGTDQVRAVEIAIEDYGEIGGHPAQLTMNEDDLCNAEGGQLGAQRIVANTQVAAVIGTSCSGAAVPASEVLSGAGYVMISGSNTSPRLTATGYFSEEGPTRGDAWSYGYFRTAHNDEFQGRAAAQFAAEELGLSTVATINDGDPYTQGLTSAMGASFEEFGGSVALATAVGAEQEDMRPVLTEVAASGAELVFFPIFEPAGNFIVLQAEEVGFEVERP